MTAQVIQLTIRSARQDKLAHEIALQRLARQHRHAEPRSLTAEQSRELDAAYQAFKLEGRE